jgi:TolA-binding protein
VVENFPALYAESTYGNDATFLLGELQYAKRKYLKARATLESLAKKPGYPLASDVAQLLRYIDRELELCKVAPSRCIN